MSEVVGLQHLADPDNEGWYDIRPATVRAIAVNAIAVIDAERALADDLADVLAHYRQSSDTEHFDEYERVLARWREARGR